MMENYGEIIVLFMKKVSLSLSDALVDSLMKIKFPQRIFNGKASSELKFYFIASSF